MGKQYDLLKQDARRLWVEGYTMGYIAYRMNVCRSTVRSWKTKDKWPRREKGKWNLII